MNSSGTVLQSTDYYPFGLAFSDANITNNRYLYNGKELEDYTVGTSYLGTLDYGARHYDPRIARWTVPDPMAEKYYAISSYCFSLNQPISLIDKDGKDVWEVNKSGEITSIKRDKTQDIFYLVDENRTRLQSISFEYGTVKTVKPNTRLQDKNITSILLNNVEAGAELFKFYADNTKTEFGLIVMRNETSMVMTSHQSNSVPAGLMAKQLDRKWETRVNRVIHNHPHNTDPSGFDNNTRESVGDKYATKYVPKALHYVYKPESELLVRYDSKQIYEAKKWEAVFPISLKR